MSTGEIRSFRRSDLTFRSNTEEQIAQMDDPLRPKTVPLSAETILWFEFLLDPSLLTTHLAKESVSPSPIELISKFLSIAPEQQNNSIEVSTPDIDAAVNGKEKLTIGRKQLALKILGLKVAARLNWNLQILERNLSLQKQVQLLSDLCTVTSGKLVNLPLSLVHECQIGPDGSKAAFNFALTMYHRWVLRAQVLKEISSRIFKQGFSHILATQEQANSFRDEMFLSSLEPFTQTSIDFLTQIYNDSEPFIQLTYESFIALCANAPSDGAQDFDKAVVISKAELRAQIAFDLCRFYLYDKKYELAREKALECRDNLALLKMEYVDRNEAETPSESPYLFCTFTEEELQGNLMACGVDETANIGLLHRMNDSMIQDYKDITDIFDEDNFKQEIPLVHRRILEADLEGLLANGLLKPPKEILVEVAALNVIRAILDEHDLYAYNDYIQKYQKQNGFTILLNASIKFLKKSSETAPDASTHATKVKAFFEDVLFTFQEDLKPEDVTMLEECGLFTPNDIKEINFQKHMHCSSTTIENISLSPLATMTDWKLSESKNKNLELGLLKRQLITCTSASTVRKLLVKLAAVLVAISPTLSLEPWHINASWIMPIQIKSVLISLQRGFFQDFGYILVAKAKDMAARNEFESAINMLSALKSETQRHESNPAITKLAKLVDYEILLLQMTQTLEEWPRKTLDNATLIAKCKQCFSVTNSDGVVPRLEILDACAAMLLNLNEPSVLISADVRYPSSELYSAVANTIIDLEQQKTNAVKKICRDVWDLVLPMFASNNPTTAPANTNKRGGGVGTGGNASSGGSNNNNGNNNGGGTSTPNVRDSPTIIVSTSLLPFLKKLRDPLPISIMLSLLARLHNILDDETNMELNTDNMHLWPTSVSNASGYSTEVVSETLKNLLKQALTYYPMHTPWIRLRGDLEFRNENYETAMASYVSAIITGSEFCTVNIQRQIDDYIIRRMIKCSSNLGCYLQATILCQFLEEIDYSLAFKTFLDRTVFKTISEKLTHYSDAMDSYYNCIWDPTLLEFIVNLESKKGEHKRKQQAIAILGQLELNANNNDEVKREAASIRRIKFLRSLAQQYLL